MKRNLYELGLQVCGISMLSTLATVSWGFFVQNSKTVLVLAAVAILVGLVGIGLVGYGYFVQKSRL